MQNYWSEEKANDFANGLNKSQLKVALLGLGLLQLGSVAERKERLASRLQGRYIEKDFDVCAGDRHTRDRILENYLSIKDKQIADEMSRNPSYWDNARAKAYVTSLSSEDLTQVLERLNLLVTGSEKNQRERLAGWLTGVYDETEFSENVSASDERARRNILDEYLDEVEGAQRTAAADGNSREDASKSNTAEGIENQTDVQESIEITGADGAKRSIPRAVYDMLFSNEQNVTSLQAEIASLSVQPQQQTQQRIPFSRQPSRLLSHENVQNYRFPNTPGQTNDNGKTRDLSKIMPNWKLTFKGTATEDVRTFFRQVKMMQKSAGLSDEDLVRGFHILLADGAAAHYRIHEKTWTTWSQIVTGMTNNIQTNYILNG